MLADQRSVVRAAREAFEAYGGEIERGATLERVLWERGLLFPPPTQSQRFEDDPKHLGNLIPNSPLAAECIFRARLKAADTLKELKGCLASASWPFGDASFLAAHRALEMADFPSQRWDRVLLERERRGFLNISPHEPRELANVAGQLRGCELLLDLPISSERVAVATAGHARQDSSAKRELPGSKNTVLAEGRGAVADALITLSQAAAFSRVTKRTLQRAGKAGLLPAPARRAGARGKAHLYLWSEMRPALATIANRVLPEHFPGSVM